MHNYIFKKMYNYIEIYLLKDINSINLFFFMYIVILIYLVIILLIDLIIKWIDDFIFFSHKYIFYFINCYLICLNTLFN